MFILSCVLSFVLGSLLVLAHAYKRKVDADLNEVYALTSFNNRLADHVEDILKDDTLTLDQKFKITFFG